MSILLTTNWSDFKVEADRNKMRGNVGINYQSCCKNLECVSR